MEPQANDLFNAAESRRLKHDGMEAAEYAGGREHLETARGIARSLALNHPERECHADAVGDELLRQGLPSSLGPAAGSLFKSKDWIFTGRRIKSARLTNHARELKIWRLA